MKLPFRATSVACLVAAAAAVDSGLVGYGIEPYEPPCAHACQSSLASLMLACSVGGDDGGHSHGASGMTPPRCRAGDTPWLTTLAWCMKTKCAPYGLATSRLQMFWEQSSTGDPAVAPKWDYPTTLHEMGGEPREELAADAESLNSTMMVNNGLYTAQYNSMVAVYRETVIEGQYA
jgi:hypothetical protein